MCKPILGIILFIAKIDDWKPEVGMEVFVVPMRDSDKPYYDRITRVGKSYFYVGNKKYSISTKEQVVGIYFSSCRCYRSEEDYRRVVELREKRHEIGYSVHKLTDGQVDQVYEWIKTNAPQP